MKTNLFTGLLLASLTAVAGDVKTDFNPDIDFTVHKTFSFVGGQEMTKTGLLADPQVRERIKNFISGSMELRGMKEVPRDQKYSLAVRYWVARKLKTEETVTGVGLGGMYGGYPHMYGGYPPYWGGAWGWGYEEWVVRNFVEGTLIVDLLDPQSKELVWRTYLRQKVEDRAKAYGEAKANLAKSFALYPPSEQEKTKMRKTRAKLEKKYAQ
ncbi:MAG: DUF4136 domain-containing protein [Bryobacterales bacterium]|nr:DUF4136 domain-containing protein [Bryobacterales bacterium]